MNGQNKSKLIIRPLHPQDAANIHAILSHPNVTPTTIFVPSRERQETEAWVAQTDQHHHRFVAEQNSQVIGLGTLHHYTRARRLHAGELNLFIHPDSWGQSVGTTLMTTLTDLADNWLDLKRIELDVFASNKAAIHLYQKFGFTIEGTQQQAVFMHGAWEDVHFMGRLKS